MHMSELKPAKDLAAKRVSRFQNEAQDYAEARTALLAEEIEVRRHLTRLAEQRRRLPPGPVVQKDYRFKDENGSEVGLADLFGDHDTLVTYFWMFGPQRDRPCPMCTNLLGGANGNGADVKQRVAFKIIGRSPVERQQRFATERGWRDLDFVQTVGDEYPRDLGLLNDKGDEYPGFTVYQKNGDEVRVFYNAEMPAEAADPGQDPRGAVDIAPLWNILDMTPAGRGTDWYPKLNY
ncbi:DUF899 family protein [Rhizobium leguminosarum]|uniref:DUF899 family protein n=1 Tax=Rhizobium leguminosarum TaxID=384 RepID=UPI0018E9B41D|nr:DUF899 family protein [Rhizobium leguminosarum]MDX6000577.1 DUF899 family protein [Rhizobium leguminosarum]